MAITINEVLEWIDQATMLEISGLVKSLEEKYGVSAAAAMSVAAGGVPAAGGEAKPGRGANRIQRYPLRRGG